MQMISKSNKGITLIALIVTVIVLSIILAISLNYGLYEIHKVSNKKIEAELTIVQEAIKQRYALIKATNQLGIIAPAITSNASITSETEVNRPEGLLGTRISSRS